MKVYRTDCFFNENEGVYLSPILKAREELPHLHEFLELIYIESGSGCHSIDGQRIEVSCGDLIFINLGQTHAMHMSDMRYINCLMKPEFISDIITNRKDNEIILSLAFFDGNDKDFDHSRCVFHFRGEELHRLRSLFLLMEQEARQKLKGYRFALSGYMQVVFSQMIRASEQKVQPSVKALEQEILQYVNRHCFDRISLQQLAEKYFYNPNYLSMKFKELCGMSLSAYIRERRMAEAARLLTDTALTVEAIYSAVGYAEKSHFYSAFKKYTGQTPQQYRNGKKS